MTERLRRASVGLLLLGVAGCASVRLDAGFPEVRAAVQERAATAVAWSGGTDLDGEAADRVRGLLAAKLTADGAVQIALLNNRELQVVYAELGLAQADVVQAGLLKNPILDAVATFPLAGGRPDLELGVAVSVLDALYVPLRKRVAAARFEEAKLRVTGAVLDFATQVRAAFHLHQADEQTRELRRTVVEALAASFEVGRRLHAAGNLSDLDLARARVQLETARIALRAAESAAFQSRERLGGLMGAWGPEAAWDVDGRVPEVPAEPDEVGDLERVALARSLELAHARQRIVATGEQLGYSRATALLPDLDLGVGAKREGDEGWQLGPSVALPLPLFDQGQARIARAATELRRARHDYYALAVRVRSAARAVGDRLVSARERALYYRDVVLPLQEQIVSEGQLHYNAMQIGIVRLLRDREAQIEAGAAYVEALRDYWLARVDLAALRSGRLPGGAVGRVGASGGTVRPIEREGH